jgi:hypothetical protein
MGELVSVREFSRRMGVTLRAIQFAIERGRVKISKSEQRGQRVRHFIDMDEKAAWELNRDPSKQGGPTRREKGKGPQPSYTKPGDREEGRPAAGGLAPDATPGPGPGGAPDTSGQIFGRESAYHKARTARELFTAKTAELEYKVRIGELVSMDEVKKVFYTTANAVTQNLLNIPARVSAILAAETDEKKVFEMLNREIKNALQRLSDGNLEISNAPGE